MRNSCRKLLPLLGVAVILTPIGGPAQDYFRELGPSLSSAGIGPVQPSDYSYRDASPSGLTSLNPEAEALEEDQHNFALGPVRFSLAMGFGVEFNDNIAYSENDRESDIILRPSLNLDASWQISEMNTLRFTLGVSYAKYLRNSEYDTDGVLLSPTSEIAYRFGLGDVMFTVRDRFSYQEDPYDIAVLSNVARYRRLENQIGIQAEWEASPTFKLTGGYDHYNLWTFDEAFDDQERSIDTVYLKPTYEISPTVRVGLSTSYSFINFETDERSDGHSFLIGPSIEWQITENTNAYLEAGFQSISYNGNSTPGRFVDSVADDLRLSDSDEELFREFSSDDSDSTSYYVRFEINNRPSEIFQHRLSGSKTAEIGFLSNYYDLYHVEYSADYRGIRDIQISPTVFYEYYETSGSFGEEAHRVGAAVGVRYTVTNSLTVGLDYRFLKKESNIKGGSYYQNLVFLSAYYKF
jgi:hypothetical protein